MKTALLLLIGVLLSPVVRAEVRTWTRSDGKTAELELISVSGSGADAVGQFKMKDGRTVTLKASGLSEADAALLAEWKPAPDPATAAAPASGPFSKILDGNLLKLSGKSLKRYTPTESPTKYYVFYYTASWCGPCHQFTPTLVDFYQKNKNANFEIVLITSDDDEGAMEEYAEEMKMPWPQLKLRKAGDFKKQFDHGVTGIPSVIVCNLDGTQVPGNFRDLAALQKLVK